jgi:hypothetical protein
VGDEADFVGRDVRGKAVIIYSFFVPGGRSHSASDRAGLFNSNTRAVAKGAALIINVMGVPGNGQFQPEGGVRTVTQMTLSQDEGFALKERLAAGEKINITVKLTVPPLTNIPTAWHYAVLPGMSDEQIQIQMHTDGYFYAAEDNNGGMASGLELARHYACDGQEKAPAHDGLDHVPGSPPYRIRPQHAGWHQPDLAVGQGGAQADARASVGNPALLL